VDRVTRKLMTKQSGIQFQNRIPNNSSGNIGDMVMCPTVGTGSYSLFIKTHKEWINFTSSIPELAKPAFVKEFFLSFLNEVPDTANQWNAIPCFYSNGGDFKMGSGTLPADEQNAANAWQYIHYVWSVPFDITLDYMDIQAATDTNGNGDVSIALMLYDINNLYVIGASGGGINAPGYLSNGRSIVLHEFPSEGAELGNENIGYTHVASKTIYFDTQKRIKKSQAIIACVKQTNILADVTCSIQLVYSKT
tara:strand:- start:1236 stop:1985 length:750 start_codon:yes stop_codon:yes gene_type:complete